MWGTHQAPHIPETPHIINITAEFCWDDRLLCYPGTSQEHGTWKLFRDSDHNIKKLKQREASISILLQIPWGLLHSITILCAVINGYRGPLIEPWISINYNLITAPGPWVINRLHLQQTVMVAIEFYPIMISFLICITGLCSALSCLLFAQFIEPKTYQT